LSEKGWTDQELFSGWLGRFLKHAVAAYPLLHFWVVTAHTQPSITATYYGHESLLPFETTLEGSVQDNLYLA